MDWLFPFYISAAIFGAGITIIDLLGLIGHHGDHDEGSGHSTDDGHHDGHDDGYVDGHHDGHDDSHVDGHDDGHDDTYTDTHHDAHDSDHADHGSHDLQQAGQQSVIVHDVKQHRNPVILLLSLARSIVYFCLGFGPVGWFALATGMDNWPSLLWSVPFGLATVFGTRAVRRLMRKELDSQVKESQLLLEKAEVLVSINKGQLGKIRVQLGDTYIERFARAKDRDKSFPAGSMVMVIDVTDDCVLVDDEA